ncbi:ornithine decarboxylase antizyme domain-containing protein [Trichoderma ceciliae]
MIREECERFFCESMKTVFLGERNLSINDSGLTGAYLQSPPLDTHLADPFNQGPGLVPAGSLIDAWMEVWDYAGGSSFRGFVADDGKEKTLFIFFDIEGVLGRDLKKALMALIELADGPLACSQIITCLDRRMPADHARDLIKSLQWVGFDMATLDHWANDLDVTSKQWIFMGMEL